MGLDEDELIDETGLTPWEKLNIAQQYIQEGDLGGLESLFPKNQEKEILKVLKILVKKSDEQNNLLIKIAVLISKMYTQGEINEETFSKLDGFLKPYYDESNLERDY